MIKQNSYFVYNKSSHNIIIILKKKSFKLNKLIKHFIIITPEHFFDH